jgi:hypothetical protein
MELCPGGGSGDGATRDAGGKTVCNVNVQGALLDHAGRRSICRIDSTTPTWGIASGEILAPSPVRKVSGTDTRPIPMLQRLFYERVRIRPKVMFRCCLCRSGIEMLSHRFAAETSRDCADGCADDGAYRSSGDRAGRRTGSDTACDSARRRSKADSNRMRTWGTGNRVWISPRLFCVLIVHSVLRYGCTLCRHLTLARAWRTRPSRRVRAHWTFRNPASVR